MSFLWGCPCASFTVRVLKGSPTLRFTRSLSAPVSVREHSSIATLKPILLLERQRLTVDFQSSKAIVTLRTAASSMHNCDVQPRVRPAKLEESRVLLAYLSCLVLFNVIAVNGQIPNTLHPATALFKGALGRLTRAWNS